MQGKKEHSFKRIVFVTNIGTLKCCLLAISIFYVAHYTYLHYQVWNKLDI